MIRPRFILQKNLAKKKRYIIYDPGGGGPPPTPSDVVLFNDGSGKIVVNSGKKLPVKGTIEFVIQGRNTVPQVGIFCDLLIPYNLIITGWTLVSNKSGSIVIDLWKSTYATFPPTIANTVTGSAKPTLVSTNKNTSTTLTGWAIIWSKNEILRVNIDSAATANKFTLSLAFTKT